MLSYTPFGGTQDAEPPKIVQGSLRSSLCKSFVTTLSQGKHFFLVEINLNVEPHFPGDFSQEEKKLVVKTEQIDMPIIV